VGVNSDVGENVSAAGDTEGSEVVDELNNIIIIIIILPQNLKSIKTKGSNWS
jgi:hypothetical protein